MITPTSTMRSRSFANGRTYLATPHDLGGTQHRMKVKLGAIRLGTSAKVHYAHVLQDMEHDATGGISPIGFACEQPLSHGNRES